MLSSAIITDHRHTHLISGRESQSKFVSSGGMGSSSMVKAVAASTAPAEEAAEVEAAEEEAEEKGNTPKVVDATPPGLLLHCVLR